MAQYSNLKAYIEEKIYENGTQAITGDILQDVLKVMTDDLGEFYQTGGVASPSTDPGTPDAKVIYFATEAGTYTNFGGITLAAGEVALLIFETSWTKETLNVLSSANGGVKTANLADGAVTTEKIAGGAVETAKIANNAVTSGKVADGAIGTAKIADGAIDADKIAANAVESAKIKNGAVTEGKINDGAVTADKVAANAVTTAKIADDAVTTAKLNDGAVTEDKIATDAVTSGKVKDGAIGTAKIAAGAVTHAKIGAGAVEESNIKDGAVTSDKIADGAVGSDQLAEGAFSAENLADGSVTTDKLADEAVTAEKIADGAVTAGKFANGSVTTIKLGSGAVTTEKIGDGMVTRQKLADSSVGTSKIIDGAVTTDKVADGAITDAKLENPVSVSQNSLTVGGNYAGEMSTTYDVTLHNSGATFASLEALLSDANLNTLIPANVRKGGMSIKFVQSSDNKYVQYRYTSSSTAVADFTNVANWQGRCDEPTSKLFILNTITQNKGKQYCDMDESNIYFAYNKIYTGATCKCKIFPIDDDFQFLIIEANANERSFVAFIQDFNGIETSYTRSEYVSNSKVIVSIPSGTKYVAINCIDYNGLDVSPQNVYIGYLDDAEKYGINDTTLINSNVSKISHNIYPIKNLILKQNHKYKVIVSAYSNYTPDYECNLKIVNNNSDSTILKIADFNGVLLGEIPQIRYFVWTSNDVENYRIGWYGNETTTVVKVSIIDVTVDELLKNINDSNSYPSTYIGSVEIKAKYQTYTALSNLELVKGHEYRVQISTDSTITLDGELNLKIYSSVSESTVLKVKEYNSGDSLNTLDDVSFVWENNSVMNYRIGWWQDSGTTLNKTINIQVCDTTIDKIHETSKKSVLFIKQELSVQEKEQARENIDTVNKSSVYKNELVDNELDVSSLPLLPNIINYHNTWVESTEKTHLLIKIEPGSTIKITGVLNSIIALLQNNESTGTPSFSQVEPWNHRVEIGATTRIIQVPSDVNYLYCRATEPDLDFRPSAIITQIIQNINRIDEIENRINADNLVFNNEAIVFAAKKDYVGNGETYQSKNRTDTLLSIVHITDSHNDYPRVKRAFGAAKKFGSTLVNTGDTVVYSGDDINTYKALFNDFEGTYLHCIGNHDAWSYANPSDVYNKWFKPFIEDFEIPWQMANVSYPTYYYWDDTTYKIRYISVDQWRATGTNPHYRPTWTQEQIDFIIATLESVPAQYGVIVLMHSPEVASVKDNSYSKFYDDTDNFSGLAIAPLKDIIDAFISKTIINKSITNTSTSETLSLVGDFTSVLSNEFIAYICGHTHKDYIHYINGAINRQLVLCETCTTAIYSLDTNNSMTELSDLGRSEEGVSQDAFNLYVIDRSRKQVKIVRLGADMPFDFSEPRNYMIIPYKV